MNHEILFAGFGGQGILFAGKVLVYAGMLENRQVSWLPSYGPEMRGGTANCSVIISDDPIGSPIINDPAVLVAMNLPSLDKYESTVAPGGTIYVDSTLIERKVTRTDVKVVYVPATKLAQTNNLGNLANMVMLGKVIRESAPVAREGLEDAVRSVVSAKHADLYDANLKALQIGYELN